MGQFICDVGFVVALEKVKFLTFDATEEFNIRQFNRNFKCWMIVIFIDECIVRMFNV